MKSVVTKSVKTTVKRKIDNKVVELTQYQDQVLRVNREMKKEFSSLNGAIRFILLFSKECKLDKRREDILKAVLKDDGMYKAFSQDVRKTKKGKYPVFYVLQFLNKNIVEADKAAAKATKQANKK